jgi:hypothetical protein
MNLDDELEIRKARHIINQNRIYELIHELDLELLEGIIKKYQKDRVVFDRELQGLIYEVRYECHKNGITLSRFGQDS